MTIKNKGIINIGIKLFNGVHQFKYACSEYFKLRNKGATHEFIKEYMGLNEIQENFIKNLWETPEYKKGYEEEPWVIIYNGQIKQSLMRWWNGRYWESNAISENKGPALNEIQKEFNGLEIFKRNMFDFMVLKFKNITDSEIQIILDLTENQITILSRVFDEIADVSDTMLSKLECIYFNGV